MESESQRRYRDGARLLGEIGELLSRVDLPRVEVRLPRRLAEQAVAAWEWDDDGVVVHLDAGLIGLAVGASDDLPRS